MSDAILVIGTGISARAVINDAVARGIPVVLVDDRADAEVLAEFAALGVQTHAGLNDEQAAEVLATVALVCPSPGVPFTHPLIVAAGARGIPVRSEIDLGLERINVPVIAVTGTNGKTTVTSLIDTVLQRAGRTSATAGNIGRPIIELVDEPLDVIVAELSSFQLHFTYDPGVRIAVWLNIADDHYDWHPDLEHYSQAKARIFAGQGSEDLFVYNADDPIVTRFAALAPGRTVGFSLDGRPDAYTVRDGALVAPDGTVLCARDALPYTAPHDIANVLAVWAVARDLGVSDGDIAAAIADFRKLPHRVERVCEADGVTFVDDSKATNPHAAIAAIRSFPSVVLIAGGKNKGLDLGVLRETASHLRGVVGIGDSADEVVAALSDLAPTTTAPSMRDAVAAAAAMAQSGDVVLLAPACASFDWYKNYGERGDDFAREARAHCGVSA